MISRLPFFLLFLCNMKRILLYLFMAMPLCMIGQPESIKDPVVIVRAGPENIGDMGAGFVSGIRNGELFIITAHHVIKNFPTEIMVTLAGESTPITAKIEAQIESYDLAILTIPLQGITIPISYKISDLVPAPKDEVIVIGHPTSHFWDVNQIVQVKSVEVSGDYVNAFLQLYPTGINSGNSGGVVLTKDYELIGMVQQVSGTKVDCLRASFIKMILERENIPQNKMTGVKTESEAEQDYSDQWAGEMVLVKGGSFNMGNSRGETGEKPVHQVTVGDFWIGKYEVTNAQFCSFLNEKGNRSGGGTRWLDMNADLCGIRMIGNRFSPKTGAESQPVGEVSWYGAVAYLQWLSSKTGHQYRLPTEAEWEYAAHGGQEATRTTYAGSNNPDVVAWYNSNRSDRSRLVGQKAPNELGIYDMTGNVWEWCSDWYLATYYQSSPNSNPPGPASGSKKAIRGGCWRNIPEDIGNTVRNSSGLAETYDNLGFRVCRVL